MVHPFQGYANTYFPLDALAVHDEIFHRGLKPDRRTYNTLVQACGKSGTMDSAMELVAKLKVSRKYLKGKFKFMKDMILSQNVQDHF